jgi:hypothetical protein
MNIILLFIDHFIENIHPKIICKLMMCNKNLYKYLNKIINPNTIQCSNINTRFIFNNIEYFNKYLKLELINIYNRYKYIYNNELITITTLNELILRTIPDIYDNQQRYQDIKLLLYLGANIDTIELKHNQLLRQLLNKSVNFIIPFPIKYINDIVFTNMQLESVIIPDTVEYIGIGAFENNNLKSIIFPDSLIHIGMRAFKSNKLLGISLPNNNIHIGINCFYCNNLSMITIPESVKNIELNAFSDNPNCIFRISKNTKFNTKIFDKNSTIIVY